MSASREKKQRQGSDKPVVNQQKKGNGKIVKWLIGAVCIVLCLVFAGSSLLLGSSWPHTHLTAATVGDYKLTAADLNYYYKRAYSSMAESLGEYSDSMIGFFSQSIMDQCVVYAQETYAAYFAALEEGYSLTEEEKAELDETIEAFETTAPLMGFKNSTEYLEYVYGKGCNPKNYREYNEVGMLAQRYIDDKLDAFVPNQADKDAYYAENKEDVDRLTYRQFFISVDEETGMTLEKAQSEGERMRAEAEKDLATFTTNAQALAPEARKNAYATDSGSTLSNVKPSLMTEEYVDPAVAAWLKDEARKEGDTATFTKSDNSGVYVLYFLYRDVHDYTSRNIRLIKVSVNSETGTEEDWNTAKDKAQSHLDDYLAGDKTPETFGALADKHSQEGIEGGLHVNVGKNDIVVAVNDWLYEDDRKEGDVELIQGADGWYVALYCGEGERYWDVMMDSVMDEKYYNTILEELKEQYPAEGFTRGQKYVTTTSNIDYSGNSTGISYM